MGAISEAEKLERLIIKALGECNLPSPHKRGIINSIESRMRRQEQMEKNEGKLQRLMGIASRKGGSG